MEGEKSVVNIPEQIFFVQVHLFFVGLLLNVDAAQFLEELKFGLSQSSPRNGWRMVGNGFLVFLV